jgi:hypothetical protein
MTAHERQIEHCTFGVVSRVGDRPIGTAFLVSDELLLTCAHVIEESIPQDDESYLGKTLEVFDPIRQMKLPAEVVLFIGVGESVSDVALLRCKSSFRERHAAMLASENLIGAVWGSFGFPADFPRGAPIGRGLIGAATGEGHYTLLDIRNTAFFVEPGFSGAPVWDLLRNCTIGMIAEESHRNDRHFGLMIPASAMISNLKAFSIPSYVVAPWLFGKDESDRLVQIAKDAGLRDRIARYLVEALGSRDDPSERAWIYTTAGEIGGDASYALIRRALREEKYVHARNAAVRAAYVLGVCA